MPVAGGQQENTFPVRTSSAASSARAPARSYSCSTRAGPVAGHLLLGLVDVAAGVVVLVWPGPTALVLVLIVATWAIVGGLFEFFAGFRHGEAAGTRALYLLGGLVSVAFGVALFARPGVGAVTLAILFGLFNLIYGAWQFVLGIELRQTDKTLRAVGADQRAHSTAA